MYLGEIVSLFLAGSLCRTTKETFNSSQYLILNFTPIYVEVS